MLAIIWKIALNKKIFGKALVFLKYTSGAQKYALSPLRAYPAKKN